MRNHLTTVQRDNTLTVLCISVVACLTISDFTMKRHRCVPQTSWNVFTMCGLTPVESAYLLALDSQSQASRNLIK